MYQLSVSPLLWPACRYYPTCSVYTQQAVIKYGAGKGMWLGLKRICRCHPFGGQGFDPLE